MPSLDLQDHLPSRALSTYNYSSENVVKRKAIAIPACESAQAVLEDMIGPSRTAMHSLPTCADKVFCFSVLHRGTLIMIAPGLRACSGVRRYIKKKRLDPTHDGSHSFTKLGKCSLMAMMPPITSMIFLSGNARANIRALLCARSRERLQKRIIDS